MSISSTTIFHFLELIKFITQSYLFLLNLFLFLSTFSVFLNDYFSRWLAIFADGKSILSRFSVLINYIMCSYSFFSVSSCFPRFSWSRIFKVQVFQGRVQGLGPGFRRSPTSVHIYW